MLGGLFNAHKARGMEEGQCGEITKGSSLAEAMIFAIDNINSDPNLLPNISLGYDIRDCCEDNEKTARNTYELLENKCCANTTQNKRDKRSTVALIGPTYSTAAIFISGFLQMRNVTAISGTATSAELSSKTYQHLYRTVPSDTVLASAVADIIDHFHWTYVAAVGVDESYGRYGIWSVIREAENKGSFCVARTEFIKHNTQNTNIKNIINKLRRHETIRVIILWMYGAILDNVLREIRNQNLSGRVWILSEASTTVEVNGFASSNFLPLHGSIAFKPHQYQDAGFREHMKAMLRNEGKRQDPPEWWTDIRALVNTCLTLKENTPQRQDLRKEICVQNVVHAIYSSFAPFVIDAVYSVAHALNIAIQDNKTHAADNKIHRRAQYTTDFNMQELLSRVNFSGLTGQIVFSQFGDKQSAVYDITNFQQVQECGAKGLKGVIVGKWDVSRRLQLNENIRWIDQTGRFPKSECLDQCSPGTRQSTTSPCCWECIPCPRGTINPVPGAPTCIECPLGKHSNKARTACVDLPLANFQYSSAGGIAVLTFGALGIVSTLISVAVICRFWNTPIVKASNRELSLALLSIIFLMLSMAFINLLKPTDTICKIIYPWRYMTYNLCLSLLLVKVLRISSAFQICLFSSYRITSLTNRTQAVIVVTLQVFLLIVLITCLQVDPPFTVEQIYPEQYTLIHCNEYSTVAGKSLFSLTCSYILIKMLLCAVCSFKVRNVPENFSEAKRIAFSMYMFLISLLAYYPVKFSIEGWYVTVVDCVTTLLSAYGFLCCIFLPKLYIILYRPELNTSVNVRQEVTHFSFGLRSVRVSPAIDRSPRQSQT